jgi:hypothetical protein
LYLRAGKAPAATMARATRVEPTIASDRISLTLTSSF